MTLPNESSFLIRDQAVPRLLLLFGFLRLIVVPLLAQQVNLSFSGDSGWNSSSTVPASASLYLFPDGVARRSADFIFRSGSDSIWNFNNGSTVIFTQSGANASNRFFIGSSDGTRASLTFTTKTPLTPGIVSARLSSDASFRIGEASTSSSGTLRIDGGIRIQTGFIYGEGPDPVIQIANGRLDVISSDSARRLNGIALTFGPKGQLWITDPNGTIKNSATFSSYASGATLTAPGGSVVFKNNVTLSSILGDRSSGTLITVDSSLDSDADGLSDSWEIANQLDPGDNGSQNPLNGPLGDPDSDGSNNLQEFQRDTNPRLSDTDQDGLADGAETNTGVFVSNSSTGSNPLSNDTDQDGYNDGAEIVQKSNPNDPNDPGTDPDLDQDGLPNTWETAYRLSPSDSGKISVIIGPDGDPDSDGLTNAEEYFLGSDPLVNQYGYSWQPQPLKAGILVVGAHPDDEGIFFGGALPYYTQVTHTPVAFICMTSGDYNNPYTAVRENQLRRAAWTYGLRNQPLLPRFKDTGSVSINDVWDIWADGVLDGDDVAAGKLRASYYVAKQIRRFRPEVLVTHGAGGEYGHTNHIATSQSVVDAWTIAANPAIELDGLPPWQAKKIYLHEWGSNRLFHDHWESEFTELTGKSPREVAIDGLLFHANKSKVSTTYLSGEVAAPWDDHPSEWWGLYSTTVGSDTVAPNFTIGSVSYTGWAKSNFLEHVTITTNALPLIECPSPIEAACSKALTLPAVIIDDSPFSSQTFAWSVVSGPGEVTFAPSAACLQPRVSFQCAGHYLLRLTASDGNSTASRDVIVRALPAPSTIIKAINCGGPIFTDVDGTIWQADDYFNGGSSSSASSTKIQSTTNDPLYQDQRTGNCSYSIPLPNDTYLVTLRFAETDIVKNQSFLRRFNINIENQRVENSLDLFAKAGFARAFDRSYSATVTDGTLNIQLAGEVDKPAVAAILIRAILPESIQIAPTLLSTPYDPLTDYDGDGILGQDEFIQGTSWTTPDPPPLTLNIPSRKLSFLTRVAEGPDYTGRTRRYRVEASPDLQPGSWTPIWTGDADGSWKDVSLPEDASRGFFRLVTILE